MHSALVAEFLKLKAIRGLFLILRRDVIAILTFCALKRDVISWHNSSTAKLLVYQLNPIGASLDLKAAVEA
jgi:hypothetical protein